MMNYINIFFASSGDKSSAKVQRQSGTRRIPDRFLPVKFERALRCPKSLTSNETKFDNTQKYRKAFEEGKKALSNNDNNAIKNYFDENAGNKANGKKSIINTLCSLVSYNEKDPFKFISEVLSCLGIALTSTFRKRLDYSDSDRLAFLQLYKLPESANKEKEVMKSLVLLFKYLATGKIYKKLGIKPMGGKFNLTSITEKMIEYLLIGQLIIETDYGNKMFRILQLEYKYNASIEAQFGLLGENFFQERAIKRILSLILEKQETINKDKEFIKAVEKILDIVSEIEKNVKNKNELDENELDENELDGNSLNIKTILSIKNMLDTYDISSYEKETIDNIKSNINNIIFLIRSNKKENIQKFKEDILELLKQLEKQQLEYMKTNLLNILYISVHYSDQEKLAALSLIKKVQKAFPSSKISNTCALWSKADSNFFYNGLVHPNWEKLVFSLTKHSIERETDASRLGFPIVLQKKGKTCILNDKNFLDIMEKNWEQMSEIEKQVKNLIAYINSLPMEEIERNFILGSEETIEVLLRRKSQRTISLIVQKTKTLFEKIKEKTETFFGSIYLNLFCCKRRKANKEEFEISTNKKELNEEEFEISTNKYKIK